MPGSTRELGCGHVWHPLTLWEGRFGDPLSPWRRAGAESIEGGACIQGAAPLWCSLTSRWLTAGDAAIGVQLDRLALTAMLGPAGEPATGPAAGLAPVGISVHRGGAAPAARGERVEFERWDHTRDLERALERESPQLAAVIVSSPFTAEAGGGAAGAFRLDSVRELCDRHLVPVVCDEVATLGPRRRHDARHKIRLLRKLLAELAAMDEVAAVRRTGFMAGIDLGRHEAGVRMGRRVALAARERGAIVQSLGDSVALVPPLAIGRADLRRLVEITAEAIRAAHEGAYGIRTPAEPTQLSPKPISHPLDIERAA